MTTLEAQLLLTYLGYEPGIIDGINGPNTKDAVKTFQEKEGLIADGIVGKQTSDQLKNAVAKDRFYESLETPTTNPSDNTGTFWNDIKYFARNDPYIACSCGRCGGFPVEPTEELMQLADRVREQAGAAMIPSSTVRCKQHNAEVGGVNNSRHLLGKAMDFRIQGWSSAKTLALVKKQSGVHYTYAIDNTYVHMDVE